MWVRKPIDISFGDLFAGIAYGLSWRSGDPVDRQIRTLLGTDDLLATLSVRSGFDSLLGVVDWERGSEVLLTGLTIPDMPRIVAEHGFRPIGLDVDPDRLAPNAEEIRARITPRTRAIVVAHLWGGTADLSEIVELARQHDLLLIEDCAQAYVGNQWLGDPRSDVAMFSFGSIKTNSALGGAVLRVENKDWLSKMRKLQAQWPVQSRTSFLKRLMKYLGIRMISTPSIASLICFVLRVVCGDHDRTVSRMAKGFAGSGFFTRIRQQPSIPLLKLLARKLAKFDTDTIAKRTQMGNELVQRLQAAQRCDQAEWMIVGGEVQRPTHWLFAVLVQDPDALIQALWSAGFDATGRTSLVAFDAEKTGVKCLPSMEWIRRHLVLIPLHPKMPNSELDRMVRTMVQQETCPPSPRDQPIARPLSRPLATVAGDRLTANAASN